MRTPRRTGRPNRLIVSPHLDDAVLSAWHAMADGPTTVVTVFAGIPMSDTPVPGWDQAAGAHNSAKLMQQRHAEDLKVLEAIEAQPVHLDFLDEQYRDGRPPTQAIIDALDQLPAHVVFVEKATGGSRAELALLGEQHEFAAVLRRDAGRKQIVVL